MCFLLCRYYGRNGLIKRLNRGMERLLKMLGELKGKIKGMKTQKKGDPLDLNKLQVRHSVHFPTLRLPRFFFRLKDFIHQEKTKRRREMIEKCPFFLGG